ncbi:MAG: hypothetical protein IPN85_12960 [Flavobacteriales bacterium]|nr:hypothetical protein [Flavobacteriales bacterium]
MKVIQDKIGFRQVQAELGIPAPAACEALSGEQIAATVRSWRHGGIVKPVDTSGSKGVHRAPSDITPAAAQALLDDALSFSRAKRVILEEYLPRKSRQMTGDALIVDGTVRFWCFGDVHFNDQVNGLVPRGVSIPGTVDTALVKEAMAGVQRVVSLHLRQGVSTSISSWTTWTDPSWWTSVPATVGNMLNTSTSAAPGWT